MASQLHTIACPPAKSGVAPRRRCQQQLRVTAVAEVERLATLNGAAAQRVSGEGSRLSRCRQPPTTTQILAHLLLAPTALQRGVPEGTPVVPVRDLPSRPRRNRKSETVRRAFSETYLHPANFILPVFVHDGEQNIPIDSMPGVSRLGWRHGLIDAVAEARSLGVNQVGPLQRRCTPARTAHPETLLTHASPLPPCATAHHTHPHGGGGGRLSSSPRRPST